MNRRHSENTRLRFGLWVYGVFGVLSANLFNWGFDGKTGNVQEPWRWLSMLAAKISGDLHATIIKPVIRRQRREGRWLSFEQLFEQENQNV
jgi:hypothetical protein